LMLNTINNTYVVKNLPVLYTPMDPRYLYPDKVVSGDGYKMSAVSYDPKPEFCGTGLDDLMLKRGEIIDSKIQLLVSEIYQRQKLQKENLYHIGLDQCTCRNLIYRMDEDVWDRKRIEIERKIIDLEQEKRMEQTSYFRDILFLKKEFRESLIEKLEEKQKIELLLDQEEDITCNP